MLKDLFGQTIRVGLSEINMRDMSSPSDSETSPELRVEDSFSFSKNENYLRVEFTKAVSFDPPSVFNLSVSYFVEHILNHPGSLNSIPDAKIREEIINDIGYYSQQSQGFAMRLSLIIAQLTSSFGGPPLVLPPQLDVESKE